MIRSLLIFFFFFSKKEDVARYAYFRCSLVYGWSKLSLTRHFEQIDIYLTICSKWRVHCVKREQRTPPLSKPNGKYKVIKALSEWQRIGFMKNRELDIRWPILQDFRMAPYIYYAYTSLFKITLAETILVVESFWDLSALPRILLDFQYSDLAVLCPSNLTLNLTYSGSFSKNNLEIGHFTLSIDTAAQVTKHFCFFSQHINVWDTFHHALRTTVRLTQNQKKNN